MQEDALEPDPAPLSDLRSRYQLAQFRILNRGQSAALDVQIEWADQKPLLDAKGKEVTFGSAAPIPVIPPGKSASIDLGTSNEFILAHSDTTYRGSLRFRTPSGRKRAVQFVLSAEYERKALLHDEERPATEYQLQKIPEALDKIAEELRQISKGLEKRRGRRTRG